MTTNQYSKMAKLIRTNAVPGHSSAPVCQSLEQRPADQGGSRFTPLPESDDPSPSYASSIEEARTLVRQCAEPCPAGDSVKAAIRRASRRLDLSFSRTRNMWYGDARRIDAQEMDRLRQAAFRTQFTNAIAGVESLADQILASRSEGARQVAAGLNAALCALGRNLGESAGVHGVTVGNPQGRADQPKQIV
jgi:hypothetical protein